MLTNDQTKKVGLVLGSGSARGWAHIGVIEALEAHRIPIHLITGTSIGAYVGAVYAGGGLESLKQFALSMDWKIVMSYLDVVFPRSGFMDGKKTGALFKMHTDAETFDDLSIPVKMAATDMRTGEQVVLDEGDLVPAIRATCSVPGVLTPFKYQDRWLVDGGLVDPNPVGLARAMGADVVIAVDLNTGLVSNYSEKNNSKPLPKAVQRERNELVARLAAQYDQAGKLVREKIGHWFKRNESSPHIIDVLGASMGIMQERIAKTNFELNPPDVIIQPRLGNLKMFDFDQAERSITEGYRRTVEQMDQIRNCLAKPENAILSEISK